MGASDLVQALIDQTVEWQEKMPDLLVDMLLEGEHSPFVPKLSPADKLAYYQTKFFNPDGTPNQAGRQEELNRLGVPDYIKTLAQMEKLRGTLTTPEEAGF